MRRARRELLYTVTGPPPRCLDCGVELPSDHPRVQIAEEGWLCPDHALIRERGNDLATLSATSRRRKPLPNQLDLLALYPCGTCNGAGHIRNRVGERIDCPTCRGAGTLDYDPTDKSEIPF